VALGILQGIQNGLILGTEVKSEHFVDLVDHLGGGGVFRGSLGVFAGRPLDAGDLGLITGSVHEEAHATAEVSLGKGGLVGRPGRGSDREEAEAKDDGLQDNQDEQVGQVERQHLRG